MKELLNNIKRDAKDFTEKLAEESDVDLEEEEFLGVDNMIKAIDLERELEEIEKKYRKNIKEKDRTIEEKDKEILRLRKQLRKR